MSVTEQLASLALAIRYDRLPGSTVRAAKRLLLDTLGCAIGAVGCEPAGIAASTLRAESPLAGAATVIGGESVPVEHAALINGVLVRYLDFMDVYWSLDVCHPSENIPLALACVESARGSGRQLIEAIVVGYEAQLRLAHTLAFGGSGMHHVSAGGFVAPLIVGKMWNLPQDKLAHAIALSGMRHLTLGALSKGGLSMAKAFGYPLSAMESFLSTRLAANGVTGPLECIDWMMKHVPTRDAAGRMAQIDLALDCYLIERVSLKQFPVQFELQSATELATRLHREIGPHLSQIERVGVEVPEITKARTADPPKYDPRNRETADHSLPCCVAMALADGRLDQSQFAAQRWDAPEVRALIAKVDVVGNDALSHSAANTRPARITIGMAGGRQLVAEELIPLGDATRPLDDDALLAKFQSLAHDRMSARNIDALVDCIATVEELRDVRSLTGLLGKSAFGGHAR